MALGIYMALSNEEMYGTLLILAIIFAYILFNLVNLPFKDSYHNYRANLCNITQLTILLVTNYYRSLKHYAPMETKAKIYLPAILEFALIVCCLLVSGVCLVYEFYLIIKNMFAKYRMSDKVMSVMGSTENLDNSRGYW